MEENINKLFLVYPYGYYDNYYIPFYDDFITNYLLKYLDRTRIYLVVDSSVPVKTIEGKFGKSRCEEIAVYGVKDNLNIWIKDWAPMSVYRSESRIFVKTRYFPQYLTKTEKETAEILDIAGIQIVGKLGYMANKIKLILDGGGFIDNGKGVGIITNRIFSDNEDMSIDEIHDLFREMFRIKNLIILPVEPGDVTGHVDGIVRFINSGTIIIEDYPSGYKEGKEYCEKIKSILMSKLPDSRIISLMNEIPEDLDKEVKMPSATGNHVNFLLIENKLFLPDYGLNTDDLAYKTLVNNLPDIEVIRVRSKHLKKITKDGGALNCITWQI